MAEILIVFSEFGNGKRGTFLFRPFFYVFRSGGLFFVFRAVGGSRADGTTKPAISMKTVISF